MEAGVPDAGSGRFELGRKSFPKGVRLGRNSWASGGGASRT